MYRERYAKNKAVEMFEQGRSTDEVMQMLAEEGAESAQLATLAADYQKLQNLFAIEARRKRLKSAQMKITIGCVMMGCGVALSLLSYLALDGQSMLLFVGVLGGGLVTLVLGLHDKKAAASFPGA